MQITSTKLSSTEIKLTIVADQPTLELAKKHAVEHLGKDVKVPGFRTGQAPANLLEKSINSALLAEEFLNEVVKHSYPEVIKNQKLNPVAQPKIEVTKTVPYTTVEYTATVSIIGEVKLANYKKLSAKKVVQKVTSADVDKVLTNMQLQLAERKDVDRPAKIGDQTWIDFDGFDTKNQPVKGASGKNYPLVLGSNSFIPGFEDHLVGLKSGSDKEFTITFPKDYGVKALQGRKVTFKVHVVKVQEVIKPQVDENLVKKVAPELKSVEDLKADIKRQLGVEAESNAHRAYENALIAELVEKSSVEVPQELVDEQAENVMRELRQNITYRGQTMDEYLEAIGMTADEQREKEVLPEANRRLKAGVLLSEIAEKEDITITPEELDTQLKQLELRYAQDQEMIKQLKTDQGKREVGAQLLTQKTIARIIELQ